MIQINLIPDVKQEFLRVEKARRLTISISIVVILSAAGLVALVSILWGAQGVRNAFIQDGINKEYATLSQIEDIDDLVTIQNQLANIDSIHQDKSRDSRVFTILQAIDPGGRNRVQFSTVRLSPDESTLFLEGTAQNGYAAVELLKKTITTTTIEYTADGESVSDFMAESVEVGDSVLAEDGTGRTILRFSLRVIYNPQLFSNSIEDMTIARPQGSLDLTDSRLRVPESLFTNTVRDEDE